MTKTRKTDTDTDDTVPEYGPVPGEDFRADLAPSTAPQSDDATQDPAHPLHHHAKTISGPSPEPAKD